jgi:hypothetical protein
MTHGNGANSDAPLEPVTPPVARHFVCDGVDWLAWPSGASAYGTGAWGPAALEAVHFARADAPERPAFETLLAAGRFHGLFEEELVTLLRGATRVAEPGERPVKAANRRGAGLL